MKIISQRYIGDGQFMLQLGGLSSETKPTDAFVATGSQFFEDDTDAVFTFSGLTWNLEKNGQMKDLPVVTATDNGKVLKVANGVWSVGEDGGGEGGGGGAEKFVVTLTQENDTWTADKTVAEIFTAYGAGKNVVVHADQPIDIFCTGAFNMESMKLVTFGCVTMDGAEPYTYAVLGYENQETDAWMVNESPLPADGKGYVPAFSPTDNGKVLGVSSGKPAWVDSNAPLIVTLTESSGTLTGDKTYQEVKEARMAGRPVDLVLSGYTCSSVLDVSGDNSSISVTFIANGQIVTATGAPNDYVSKTLG